MFCGNGHETTFTCLKKKKKIAYFKKSTIEFGWGGDEMSWEKYSDENILFKIK